MVLMEEMVVMDCLEGQGRRETQVFRDLQDQLGIKVSQNWYIGNPPCMGAKIFFALDTYIHRSPGSQCGWCSVHQVGEDHMSKHHWNTTRVCWKSCRKLFHPQGRRS